MLFAAIIGFASILAADILGTNILGYDKSPISPVMFALIIGIGLRNTFNIPKIIDPGIDFVVKKILKLGVVLLGVRLSIGQVAKLGAVGVPIVVGCIVAALVITSVLARSLRLSSRLGTLIAVGTSVCGVSAIVATAPAIQADEEEVAYAVSIITILGLVATISYPLIAHWIFADDSLAVGLFLGTAIHDTSQVTGAGLLYSQFYSAPDALNGATVTKLVRNLFMSIVIPSIAILRHRESNRPDIVPSNTHLEANSATNTDILKRVVRIVPLFIFGFLGMTLFRTIGDATLAATGRSLGFLSESNWTRTISGIQRFAVYCLVASLAGVGLRIRLAKLIGLGSRPLLAGFGAAIAVGGVSIVLVSVLGSLVRM